jgi:hypothetical protein
VSFTLNQVTRRAGGGDITRTREFAGAEISVGRGSDCDIQLQDLAVSLRHVMLRQTGASEVTIQSIGREPFEIDGKFATEAKVTIDGPHRLVLGSHTLLLAPSEKTVLIGSDPRTRDIVITVTRNETAPTAADEDEEKIFSISDSILGKRAMAWTFALLVLVVGLAWPISGFISHRNAKIHADQQWSGGPLSQAHAFLGKNCQACHVKAFVAVRDDACLACHQAGRDQAANDRVAALNRQWGGPAPANLIRDHADHHKLLLAAPLPADLGGKIEAVFRRTFNHPNDRCASCHLEHIDGKGPPPTAGARPAPMRAIPTLMTINRCADCHGKLKERVGDTALIDTPDWGHHPDFRPMITASPGPAEPRFEQVSLVGRPLENNGLTFSHQIHLNPVGGVARMAQELGPLKGYGGPLDCAACHRPNASGKGFVPIEMVRDCSSCHSLAYAKIGGELRMLPHGHPDQVIDALRNFYSGGGGANAGMPDTSRRLPGFMEDVRVALGRFTARFTTPAAVTNGVKQVFAPGGVCAECHTVQRPNDPGSLAYNIAPVYLNDHYLPRGDFNHGVPAHAKDAHGAPTCSNCHEARTSNDAREVLLPRLSACADCHGKTAKQTPTPASADCAECHSYHAPGQASPKGADQEHIATLSVPGAPGAAIQTTQ